MKIFIVNVTLKGSISQCWFGFFFFNHLHACSSLLVFLLFKSFFLKARHYNLIPLAEIFLSLVSFLEISKGGFSLSSWPQ